MKVLSEPPCLSGSVVMVVFHLASSLSFIIFGVPQVMIPNYKEQLFTALRVREMGAGLVCERDQDSYLNTLKAVLDDRKFKEGALRFSQRHRNFEAENVANKVATQLKAHLNC